MIQLSGTVVGAALGPVRQVANPTPADETQTTAQQNGLLTVRVDLASVGANPVDYAFELSLSDAIAFKAGDAVSVSIAPSSVANTAATTVAAPVSS